MRNNWDNNNEYLTENSKNNKMSIDIDRKLKTRYSLSRFSACQNANGSRQFRNTRYRRRYFQDSRCQNLNKINYF